MATDVAGGFPSYRVSPRAACAAGREIAGEAALTDFPRLASFAPSAELTGSDEPEVVRFRIVFFEDPGAGPGGQRRAAITVDTRLAVACARCMEPMLLTVHGQGTLQFVYSDDQAAQVDELYEPVQTDDEGMVSVVELIEDEVLMAMPVVSRHEHQCRDPWTEQAEAEGSASAQKSGQGQGGDERDNPFAQLEALKSKLKDS